MKKITIIVFLLFFFHNALPFTSTKTTGVATGLGISVLSIAALMHLSKKVQNNNNDKTAKALSKKKMFSLIGLTAGLGITLASTLLSHQDTSSNGSQDCSQSGPQQSRLLAKKDKPYPIVYTPEFNLTPFTRFQQQINETASKYGIERGSNDYHVGISNYGEKYQNVFQCLKEKLGISEAAVYTPHVQVSNEDLLKAHSQEFISSLEYAQTIGNIVENRILQLLRNNVKTKDIPPAQWILESQIRGVAGTITAAELAVETGLGISLSGGYHHVMHQAAEGFCIINDVAIAIAKLREKYPAIYKKFMIIDLDAHSGNGNANIFKDDPQVVIVDAFNKDIYPYSNYRAKKGLVQKSHEEASALMRQGYNSGRGEVLIEYPITFLHKDEVNSAEEYTKDFLTRIKQTVTEAIEKEKPDFIFYNAGTDPFEEDANGFMAVTKAGIIERDAFIARLAKEKHIPLTWVLSGGYAGNKGGPQMIAESIAGVLKEHATK